MNFWTRCISRILPLLLLLMAVPALAGGYSHTRDGVVVGLDLGPGGAVKTLKGRLGRPTVHFGWLTAAGSAPRWPPWRRGRGRTSGTRAG